MKRNFSTRIIFLALALSAAGFSACAKSEKKSQSNTDGKNALGKDLQNQRNPEFEKFDRVFSAMSDRCKSSMNVQDRKEFIRDLNAVLDSENDFDADDLGPFHLIDKKNTVSADYVPKNLVHLEKNAYYTVTKNSLNLRREAYDALMEMSRDAKAEGITLSVSSTYRSYEYQKNLFDYWARIDGLEEAERSSARPGTSQHQLGLALDFYPVDDAFADTESGKWVNKNAWKYGWSLSFPQGFEDVTGYRWESWHFRYMGRPAVDFQKKYFSDVQQFMVEFIHEWKQGEVL